MVGRSYGVCVCVYVRVCASVLMRLLSDAAVTLQALSVTGPPKLTKDR